MPSSSTPIRRHVARLVLLAFVATLPGSPPLFAEVTGEQIVAGDAAFERNGDITTIHASDGAIIEYDRFNVWSNEELHFIQPHDQARVLNRVLGDITHIDGGLFANGIVYIVNPAGIFFGPEAVVDVGGLYAAAGNIANEDFLAGIDQFELSSEVENAGRIEAFSVALLGTAVANHGAIHAPDGTIALVAGERVLLTRLGGHLHVEVEGGVSGEDGFAIQQTGTVDAGAGSVSFTTGDVYSLALNHEGITRGADIDVRASSGLVQVAGVLDASNADEGGAGGDIAVTGEQVALRGATLDASGDAGGGTIRVGGDLRGAGALPNAKRTFVDAETVLRADATRDGDGGTVIVYADEATAFHGALSARGGDAGGDGGFAEISGAIFLFTDGDVDLRAVQGETGTLLYDPQDIVLRGGSADGNDDPDGSATDLIHAANDPGTLLFDDVPATPFEVFESEIEGTNANVVLEATNSIVADAAATFTNDGGEGVGVLRIVDGNSLTLRTRNDPGDEAGGAAAPGIDLNTLALRTSGGGGVTLETGFSDPADPDPANLGGSIVVGDITTTGADGVLGEAGGAVTLTARGVGSVMAEDIVTTGGSGSADVGGEGGAVTVSTADGDITIASVDSSGGNTTSASADPLHAAGNAGAISITANDADSSADSDVVTGDLVARGGSAAGGMGNGGRGGVVMVTSRGVRVDIAGPSPDIQPLSGGGALMVADVDTRGGAGGTAGFGGSGGAVRLETDDGAITATSITTSGAAGGTNGGGGGFVRVSARDADQSGDSLGDNHIVLGAIESRGGDGGTGRGGSGGAFDIDTQRSELVVETGEPENILQEALGGGDVEIASIDTRGGDGATRGGAGGGGNLFAHGMGREVRLIGSVQTGGGAGGIDPAGAGGQGGGLAFQTDDGSISVTTIDTSGGSTTSVNADPDVFGANGGGGGLIRLIARDGDASYDSNITATGNLISAGGAAVDDAVGGVGGAAGTVDVRIEGVATPVDQMVPPGEEVATSDVPVLGGGVITLQDIDASGGIGGGGGNGGAIGVGFNAVDARISDAMIDVGDIDVSGGDGQRFGGNGGAMFVTTRDSDVSSDSDISLGTLSANGGVGATGGGGRGGSVTVQAFRSLRITESGNPENILQEALGGGDVDITGDVDTSGGNGGTFGGSAGQVTINVFGETHASSLGAGIDASGGDGSDGNGGFGARVEVVHQSTDLLIDYAIDASGGDGVNAADTALGGIGGPVALRTGIEDGDAPADVTITVLPDTQRGASGAAATVTRSSGSLNVLASDRAVFDVGALELLGNTFVAADGGVEVNGSLDTHASAESELAFLATVGGVSRFAGDVGANRALANFAVNASEDAVAPTLDFEGSSVTTTGAQSFGPDARVAGDTAFTAGGPVTFSGDLDGAVAGANVTVDSGGEARFGGDVGGTTPLGGFDVDASSGIAFTGTGGQRVVTDGPAGIRLNADLARAVPPPVATIGALGDLRLESVGGDLIIGDLQKVSAAGRLELIGDRVRFTDLSGVDVAVQATTAELFAREIGLVQYSSGSVVTDGGTDIVGNTVSFSTAPTVVGNGPQPRIATLSGLATNAGGIRVARLDGPILPSDIATPIGVLDLAIPAPDPGNETPELAGGPVEVPAALYGSEDAAGPGARVSSTEVVAWLSCSPEGGAARAGCIPPAKPAYGSALDTERAAEVAKGWRRLLGDSKEAKAGRASLALASRDPDAELGGRSTSPAGRAYLQDAARLLGRTRMLGLDAATYDEVRDELVAAIVARIDAPNLDAERLLEAIEPYSMGMLSSR